MGVEVVHAWGMTEMSPIGTQARPDESAFEGLDAAAAATNELLLKQGTFSPIVAWKLLDDDGQSRAARRRLARRTLGARIRRDIELLRHPGGIIRASSGGYFMTGDVCTMDPIRLSADRRPLEGSREVGRRVDFERRSRERDHGPSARSRGRGDRRRPSALGGAPRRGGRACATPGRSTKPRLKSWLEAAASPSGGSRTGSSSRTEIPRTGVGKFLKRSLREAAREPCSPEAPAAG